MVYVLLVDRLEARCVAAMTAGADVDPDERRAELDRWLISEPESVVDPVRYELMRALGLR